LSQINRERLPALGFIRLGSGGGADCGVQIPASIQRLKGGRLSPIKTVMRRQFAHGLRAFVLILALAVAGQGLASATMAMGPNNGPMSNVSATPSDMCNGCEGMDHSKAMPSNCSIGVCSGIIAVQPAPASLEALTLRSYQSVAQDEVQGITISPPLGPPRALHFA
jgi:hypothetical protein